jgi:hypothetical protein
MVCFGQSGTGTGEDTTRCWNAESATRSRPNLSTAFRERAKQQWLAGNCRRRFLEDKQDKHRRLEDEDSSDRRDGQIKGTAYNLLKAELVRKS